MTPISATQTHTHHPLTESQVGPSHTTPKHDISTQQVKTKILELQEAIAALKTQEQNFQNDTAQIQLYIKNKAAETFCIRSQQKNLSESIEYLEQKIREIELSEQNDSLSIMKINTAHSTIHNARKDINKLKIDIRKTENLTQPLVIIEEQKDQEIKKIRDEIDSLRNNQKNLKTKENQKTEEKTNITHLEELQKTFNENIRNLITDVESAVKKLKNKNNEEQSIEKYFNETSNFINTELFKRIRSRKETNHIKNIATFLSNRKNELICELEEKSNQKLGEFDNLKRVEFLSKTMFTSSLLSGLFLFGSDYILPKKNFINDRTIETKLTTAFVLSVLSLVTLIARNIMINSHQGLFISDIKRNVKNQAFVIGSIFSSQIELIYQNQLFKSKIKNIFEKTPISQEQNTKTWINALKKENHESINKYQEKIKLTSTKIHDLTTNLEELELEKQDIANQRKRLIGQKTNQEKNIETLQAKIQDQEKSLACIKKHQNQETQKHTETLQQLWRKLKTDQCDLDLCNMQLETIQAQLRNKELLLAQGQDQLQQQQKTVDTQMKQLDLQQIANQLLRPNMTEDAFKRTVSRHLSLKPEQLLQRTQQGYFLNNDGRIVHAPARQASTYSSFYHMLYAIMDTIEFIQHKVNNNERVAPYQNYTVHHNIVVGHSVSGSSPKPEAKHTSKASYAYRIETTTQQQQLMINHIF